MTEIAKAQQLADEHWDWLEPIIKRILAASRDDELLCYLFKTAWVHGVKHVLKELNNGGKVIDD